MKHAAHVESFDRRYHHAPTRVTSRLGALHTAILLPKLEVLDEAWDLARSGCSLLYIAATEHNPIPLNQPPALRGGLANLFRSASISAKRS